jgi:hypothetical protein
LAAALVAATFACHDADRRTADTRAAAPPAQRAPIVATDTGPRYGDSTTFDPDGYYVPLARQGVLERVEHIELLTLDYDYDGSDHLDRPKLLPPTATIVIRTGADSSSATRCEQFRFSRDSLDIGCSNTPIGNLNVRLRLLDPRGRYARLADYDEQTREIAEGEVSVRSPAGVVSVQHAGFYYTGGQ